MPKGQLKWSGVNSQVLVTCLWTRLFKIHSKISQHSLKHRYVTNWMVLFQVPSSTSSQNTFRIHPVKYEKFRILPQLDRLGLYPLLRPRGWYSESSVSQLNWYLSPRFPPRFRDAHLQHKTWQLSMVSLQFMTHLTLLLRNSNQRMIENSIFYLSICLISFIQEKEISCYAFLPFS